jgi:hypothetical protein
MIFLVPLFFLWLGLWLWRAGRRHAARADVMVVDMNELVAMLNDRERMWAEASEQAAMVRTLHEIKDLEEVQ